MLGIAGYQAVELAIQRKIKKGKTMAVIKTHPNVAAFLDTLAFSEGTATHPLTRNNGYDVIVTGIDGKPEILPIIAITRSPVDARRRSSIVAGKIHGIRALPAALSVLAALSETARFA